MNQELMHQATVLASQKYAVYLLEEQVDGQLLYLAKNPELYGCMAEGSTPEEARINLEEARIDYIYCLLEKGLPIPEPGQRATSTISTSEALEAQFNLLKTVYVAGHQATTKPLNPKTVEAHLKISATA